MPVTDHQFSGLSLCSGAVDWQAGSAADIDPVHSLYVCSCAYSILPRWACMLERVRRCLSVLICPRVVAPFSLTLAMSIMAGAALFCVLGIAQD